jgi:hypothetical protein
MAERYIDDEMLRLYLADALGPEGMARVEKALRDSAELRARLEQVRSDHADDGLHSLGAIWARARLSCPSREQLGSYLLEALDPAAAQYIRFHVETIGCVYCGANLADLRSQIERATIPSQNRSGRIYDSSRHLLGGDGPPA